MFERFFRDQRGATAIEYGLICALIFLAIVTAIGSYMNETTAMYEYIADTVGDATESDEAP